MASRKDYEETARILTLSKDKVPFGAYLDLVYNFADWFTEDNPNFNEIKFAQACGLDVVNVLRHN